MSVFASETRKTVVIEDLQVVVRKLSGTSLAKARAVRQGIDMGNTRGLGGELFKVIREMEAARSAPRSEDGAPAPKKEPTLEELKEKRLGEFDRDDLLIRGVESWSAAAPLPSGLQDLTEAVQQQLFEEIVELSCGPLDPKKAAEGKG